MTLPSGDYILILSLLEDNLKISPAL